MSGARCPRQDVWGVECGQLSKKRLKWFFLRSGCVSQSFGAFYRKANCPVGVAENNPEANRRQAGDYLPSAAMTPRRMLSSPEALFMKNVLSSTGIPVNPRVV